MHIYTYLLVIITIIATIIIIISIIIEPFEADVASSDGIGAIVGIGSISWPLADRLYRYRRYRLHYIERKTHTYISNNTCIYNNRVEFDGILLKPRLLQP